MKEQNFSIIRFISLGFLSFFGTGYFPKAPGTMGSLATIPLILGFNYFNVSLINTLIFTAILFIIACFVADYIQKKENVQDPGWIVIDEVIGMLITWLFIFPKVDPINLFLVFVFFRFFDIVKIYPANWCDKNIKSGMGTIIDDVVSALYAGLLVWMINYFYPIQQIIYNFSQL